MNKRNPIFIHSLFRTGSTYIWNRFRQNDKYYCFYEPFHPGLSKVTADNIEHSLTADYESVNHPSLDKYYWHEYRQFLEDGRTGLPYFKKSFSFAEFCHNDKNPDLKKYIDHLTGGAGDKVPVMQFNRTAFRIKWFKQNYPEAVNIYLVRNQKDQWQSYFNLLEKTQFDGFFIMDLLIASINKGKECFRFLSKHLPLVAYNNQPEREEAFYRIILDSYSEEEKYLIFYYTWITALIDHVLHADFILNMDLLSREPVYRGNVTDFFTDCGLTGIDFEDAAIGGHSTYRLSPEVMDTIEEEAHYLAVQQIPEDQINLFFRRLSNFDREYFHLDEAKFLALKKKKSKIADDSKFFEKLEKIIGSFSDKYFRLLEENNTLRLSLDDTVTDLKSKERSLSEKDKQLVEKDKQLAWKDVQLSKKDEEVTLRLKQKDNQMAEKDKQLAWKDVQLTRKDRDFQAMLREKDDLLQEKDLRLADKDVQLEEKERQLYDKIEHLEKKEKYIQKIVHSASYKTGNFLLFPFKKLKRLVRK